MNKIKSTSVKKLKGIKFGKRKKKSPNSKRKSNYYFAHNHFLELNTVRSLTSGVVQEKTETPVKSKCYIFNIFKEIKLKSIKRMKPFSESIFNI